MKGREKLRKIIVLTGEREKRRSPTILFLWLFFYFLLFLGATASGKSEIVSRLSEYLNIEIIVADSIQVWLIIDLIVQDVSCVGWFLFHRLESI